MLVKIWGKPSRISGISYFKLNRIDVINEIIKLDLST